METAANISLFVVRIFAEMVEGVTAIGDDTLLIILDLAEDSSQTKITGICVQYLVPSFRREGQDGDPDECIP